MVGSILHQIVVSSMGCDPHGTQPTICVAALDALMIGGTSLLRKQHRHREKLESESVKRLVQEREMGLAGLT